MKDDCRTIGHLLAEYVYLELDETWRRRVERHLDECPPCRGDLDRLDQTLKLIDDATLEPEEHLSEHFSNLVLALLRRRAADRELPWLRALSAAMLAFCVFSASLQHPQLGLAREAAIPPAAREIQSLAKEMNDPLLADIAERMTLMGPRATSGRTEWNR